MRAFLQITPAPYNVRLLINVVINADKSLHSLQSGRGRSWHAFQTVSRGSEHPN